MTEKKKNQSKAPTKSSLYGKAQQILRDRHLEEFEGLVTDLYAEHGYRYVRRLTPEERAAKAEAEERAKAEARLAKLVQQYPVLAERVAVPE